MTRPSKHGHRTSANATLSPARQDPQESLALTICGLESLGYTVETIGDIPGLEGQFRWTNTHTFEFGVASNSEAAAWTCAAEAWGDKHDSKGLLSATHSGEVTPAQLERHYSHGGANGGGQHPVYTRAEWRHAVEDAETVKGYWAWLATEISQGKRPPENASPVQRHRGWLGAHH